MANEKIVIREINETSPKGAGTSTDVAYVPGLMGKAAENPTYNQPVLCTSVSEFERLFGVSPYEFTSMDIYGTDKPAEDTSKSTYADKCGYTVGDYDLSYIYAKELLNAGMAVYYDAVELSDEDKTELQRSIEQSVADGKEQDVIEALQDEYALATGGKIEYLYAHLADKFKTIVNRSEYSVKYITSGGYPTFTDLDNDTNNSLADTIISVAEKRGDAVALVDHVRDWARTLNPSDSKSVYHTVNSHNWTNASFGAMFTPWASYSCVTLTDDTTTEDKNEAVQLMPASFGYLMCIAHAIKTSPNWLAMAGVTRGQVPYIQELSTKQLLSNVIAEEYQPKYGATLHNISVNAITNIKPYGLTIWGNRTLEAVDGKGTTALNFLNTRNMISDIKKLAYSTAQSLMFEQDSELLWNKFKSKMSPLLNQLQSGFGISGYKILRATTNSKGEPLTRGELAAIIRVYPLYAIEYFDISVNIRDED